MDLQAAIEAPRVNSLHRSARSRPSASGRPGSEATIAPAALENSRRGHLIRAAGQGMSTSPARGRGPVTGPPARRADRGANARSSPGEGSSSRLKLSLGTGSFLGSCLCHDISFLSHPSTGRRASTSSRPAPVAVTVWYHFGKTKSRRTGSRTCARLISRGRNIRTRLLPPLQEAGAPLNGSRTPNNELLVSRPTNALDSRWDGIGPHGTCFRPHRGEFSTSARCLKRAPPYYENRPYGLPYGDVRALSAYILSLVTIGSATHPVRQLDDVRRSSEVLPPANASPRRRGHDPGLDSCSR